MALFDFLSSYVMSPQQGSAAIPAINDPGGVGVQAAVPAVSARPGLTYGDVASALMQYGSKPGSSGAMFAQTPLMPQQRQGMQQAGQSGQLADFGPTMQQQQKQKSMVSAQSIANIFGSLFGVPGGGM